MSQPSPSFHSENETNLESKSLSELDQRFSSKYSEPYIIPIENSPSDDQIATAGPSDEQIVTSRKRKDEKPIENKETKKAKLENLKEKGKIYLLLYILFNSYRIRHYVKNLTFFENLLSNITL
jgi:hypothetical protein